MAVVQYTGIVNQLRGKLNGSVFNKARNVNTLQRKQQAPRRNVGFQSEPRAAFSNAQRSWKALTPTQRTQWATAAANNPSRDRFGDLVPLSGYNQYIKAYVFATYVGEAPPETPDTNPAPDSTIIVSDLNDLVFSTTPSGGTQAEFQSNYESAAPPPGFFYMLDIGLPVSTGVTVYYGRYSFAGAEELEAIGSLTGTVDLGTRFPLPQVGQVVRVRIRIVYVPNGSVVYTNIIAYQIPS